MSTSIVKIFLVLLVVSLLATATVGGYYFYKQKKDASASPSPTPIATETWEVYSNPDIGIGFKHPGYTIFDNFALFETSLVNKSDGVYVGSDKRFDVESLDICKETMTVDCIVPGATRDRMLDIEHLSLDSQDAISFYLDHKISNSILHVVQIADGREIVMGVDSPGQDEIFNELISTFHSVGS